MLPFVQSSSTISKNMARRLAWGSTVAQFFVVLYNSTFINAITIYGLLNATSQDFVVAQVYVLLQTFLLFGFLFSFLLTIEFGCNYDRHTVQQEETQHVDGAGPFVAFLERCCPSCYPDCKPTLSLYLYLCLAFDSLFLAYLVYLVSQALVPGNQLLHEDLALTFLNLSLCVTNLILCLIMSVWFCCGYSLSSQRVAPV